MSRWRECTAGRIGLFQMPFVTIGTSHTGVLEEKDTMPCRYTGTWVGVIIHANRQTEDCAWRQRPLGWWLRRIHLLWSQRTTWMEPFLSSLPSNVRPGTHPWILILPRYSHQICSSKEVQEKVSKMVPWVKVLTDPFDNLRSLPQDPHEGKRGPTSLELSSSLHMYAMHKHYGTLIHVHIQ